MVAYGIVCIYLQHLVWGPIQSRAEQIMTKDRPAVCFLMCFLSFSVRLTNILVMVLKGILPDFK